MGPHGPAGPHGPMGAHGPAGPLGASGRVGAPWGPIRDLVMAASLMASLFEFSINEINEKAIYIQYITLDFKVLLAFYH